MTRSVANYIGVAAMALLVVAFEIGVMSSANALFGVLVILMAMTAAHFMAYEGRTVREALSAMFTFPKLGHGRALSHIAYFGASAVGVLVLAQAVTQA